MPAVQSTYGETMAAALSTQAPSTATVKMNFRIVSLFLGDIVVINDVIVLHGLFFHLEDIAQRVSGSRNACGAIEQSANRLLRMFNRQVNASSCRFGTKPLSVEVGDGNDDLLSTQPPRVLASTQLVCA